MENSLLANFDEIWPMTLYFDQVFEQLKKICKKSNFDQNQLKVSTQHKYMYVSEKIIKMENSLLANFDEIWPMTLYYSTGTLTQFLSNFKN